MTEDHEEAEAVQEWGEPGTAASQKPSEECCKTQRVPKMRPENWPLDLAMERLFVTWTGAVLVQWRWGGCEWGGRCEV